MSRCRKWWHKTNHDRVLRDQFVWNLPDEALGLLKRLECMVGSTERGHEKGVLCSDSGDKMSVDELTFVLSHGDADREALLRHRLALLARAKQLCPRALESGFVKLIHWAEDQEMPASVDNDRKRSEADEQLAKDARSFRSHLERLVSKLGNRRVSEGEVLSFIKAVRGGYSKTQNKFFEFLCSERVLIRDADGLYALAALAPEVPAGVGFMDSGDGPAGGVGAGAGNFPCGKFPIEIDPDPEEDPEMERPSSFQLDSAGAGGGTSGASAGRPAAFTGGFERTGKGRTAFCRPETRSASGSPPDASGTRGMDDGRRRTDDGAGRAVARESGMESEQAEGGGLGTPSPYRLIEPGDAYRCGDPVAASIEFLSQCPGWQQKRSANQPSSAVALRGRWGELLNDPEIGPEVAERIWRVCLDQAITDRLERQGWTSWVAIFQSRIKRQVAMYKPVPG